jgi:ABC-type sugar transport system permease subunit
MTELKESSVPSVTLTTKKPRFGSLHLNEVRENLTGYLFISPALLLIFVFGIYPMIYAIYMSISLWPIQRRADWCDTPIERGAEAATSLLGKLRQCLRHYEVNVLGSWEGTLTFVIGFATLLIVYLMWVSIFTHKRNTISGIIGRFTMALVLILALYIAIKNALFSTPILAIISFVTVIGMIWYLIVKPKTGFSIEEAPPANNLQLQLQKVIRIVIGGSLVIMAGVAGIISLAGIILLLETFSIPAIVGAYLALLLLLGVYLFFAQDNDNLRSTPTTLRINQLVTTSLKIIGLLIVANITIATAYGLYINLFKTIPSWWTALLTSWALIAILGALAIPFGTYVLGNDKDQFEIRGFVLLLFGLFFILALNGVQGTARNLYAKDYLDAGLLVVGTVFHAIHWSSMAFFYLGLILLLLAYRMWVDAFKPDSRRFFARWTVALILLSLSVAVISLGWNEMKEPLNRRDLAFLRGLEITVYYAFGSIPLQLGLGLLLAYVLFQNLYGKQWFRMVFFIPYVTPAVASAVVFQRIFTGSQTSLMNSFLASIGGDTYRWVNESRPFLNVVFGLDLTGFMAGPSMALVSVIILGIWTYTGYNAVIFLAGLGGISNDLYEAAKVDGASPWHLFRHITLPLLSPITFYLSLLGFIGTFQAFNTLFVMRTPSAGGTLDTAGLVIYDSFRVHTDYGLATAQAIVLFVIIMVLTQLQRNVFEKQVFYG